MRTLERSGRAVAAVVAAGEGETLWVGGHPITWKATSENTEGAFSVLEASVPPTAGLPPHIHHRHEEAVYVLEGRFSFQLGERVVEATAGAFVHVPRGLVHTFTCTGETWGRLLVYITPGGMEGFYTEFSRIPLDEPMDEAAAIALNDRYGCEMVIALGEGQEV